MNACKSGRRPPAFQIGIGKAQIAFPDQAGKDIRVVNRDLGHWTRARRVDAKEATIRQTEVNPAVVEPCASANVAAK